MSKPSDNEKKKKIFIIILMIGAVAVFLVGIMRKNPEQSVKKDRIVKFAVYDNDKILEEQNAYHNKMENKIEQINSNMNVQAITNDALIRKVENIENQPARVIIIKDKRKEKQDVKKDVDTPNIYGY